IRPNSIFVVRYELWLGFLEIARRYGSLYLIDVNRGDDAAPSKSKHWLRRFLLGYFRYIFVVSESDGEFFRSNYGIDQDRLAVVGDTKYDRVLERSKESQDPKADEVTVLVKSLSNGRKAFIF